MIGCGNVYILANVDFNRVSMKMYFVLLYYVLMYCTISLLHNAFIFYLFLLQKTLRSIFTSDIATKCIGEMKLMLIYVYGSSFTWWYLSKNCINIYLNNFLSTIKKHWQKLPLLTCHRSYKIDNDIKYVLYVSYERANL